jgi:hypothetical protein
MREEPLYVRFANGLDDSRSIARSFLAVSQHEPSRQIAQTVLEGSLDLVPFRNDFKSMLQDLIDNGVNQRLINYVDSYMKPSLEEMVESTLTARTGEKRHVNIKSADTPWVEAVVCYNLCLFIKAYGIKEIKRCATCLKFFTNKGKYAVYCSEECKKDR